MNKPRPITWLCFAALVLYVAGSVMGQLQQSGGPGSSVTLQSGSNLVGKVGLDQTTPGTTNGVSLAQVGSTAIATGNGVAGAGVQRVAIASDQTPFAVNAALSTALPAGSNVIGTVIVIPKTSCAGNALATGSALAAVPTSLTLLTSATTACVIAAIFHNPTSGALTVTLSDNTATPVNALLTFSIPAFSSLVEPLYGSAFNLGVKWAASGAGVTGSVIAIQ
jgi:hypothetical protein